MKMKLNDFFYITVQEDYTSLITVIFTKNKTKLQLYCQKVLEGYTTKITSNFH